MAVQACTGPAFLQLLAEQQHIHRTMEHVTTHGIGFYALLYMS